MKNSLIAVAVITALTGCGATDYIEQRDAANETLDSIRQIDKQERNTKSIYVSRPPLSSNDGISASSPLWLRKDANVKGNNLPLNFLLRNMLKSAGQNITLEYGPDVNAQKMVSVDYSGNIDGALKEISSKGDVSITVTGAKVHVDRYVTKVFELNSILGKSAFLFGNKTGGGSSNNGDGLATRTVASQLGNSDAYSNTEGTEIDPFKDYLDAITAILRKDGAKDDEPLEGAVTVTPSTAAILVRTTPSRMNLVERYVAGQKESVARQVMLEVKVLQFKGNKGSEFGIDWNIIRTLSDGQLDFTGSTLPSISDSGGNYGFSFTSTHPLWDGTTILMKALQTQGHVGVEYEPRTVARNNRVATIDNSEKITYIARVVVTPNENSDASVEVEDAVVSDGLIMSVLPNISDGIINLQISGLLSKVTAWEDTEVSGVKIRAPQVQEIKFNQDVGLKYGETLVLNGYKQKANRSDATSMFKVGLLGGNAGVNATTETIVLITPKRI